MTVAMKSCRQSCTSLVMWTCALMASSAASAFVIPSTKPVAFRPPMQTVPGWRPATSLHMAQRRGRPRGPLRTIEVKPTMNDEITYNELRVVTPNPKGKDEALGIMSKDEALAKAQELGGLDLILINENSDPPVCKIVDYSKYRYMKEKKAKELKKNSKASEVKEVKMSYKIDVHDYGVRKKNASKFLNQGNRVKVTIMFRGREVQHDKLGYELIDKLAGDLDKICLKEGKPTREGRNLSIILTPRPEVTKAVNEGRRAEEKAKKKKKEDALKAKQAAANVAVKEDDRSGGLNTDLLDDADINLNEIGGSDSDDLVSSLDDLLGSDDLTDDLFA